MSNVTLSHFIGIKAPYNNEFHDHLRQIDNSSYDYVRACWIVPGEALDLLKKLIMEHFGTDGTIKDQVQLHIALLAGAIVESPARSLDLDGWPILRMSNFRVLPGQLATFHGVETFKRKAANGGWFVGLRSLPEEAGDIVIAGIGKKRAERVLVNFQEGALEGHWQHAIKSVRIASCLDDSNICSC